MDGMEKREPFPYSNNSIDYPYFGPNLVVHGFGHFGVKNGVIFGGFFLWHPCGVPLGEKFSVG